MMYATVEDFLASVPNHLVIELAGNMETQEINENEIETYLVDASSTIDGYVGSRYDLPLPTAPAALKGRCIDIALYNMQRLRATGDIEDSRERYLDAISFLKDLIKGIVSLGLPQENTPPPNPGPRFRPGSSIMKGLSY